MFFRCIRRRHALIFLLRFIAATMICHYADFFFAILITLFTAISPPPLMLLSRWYFLDELIFSLRAVIIDYFAMPFSLMMPYFHYADYDADYCRCHYLRRLIIAISLLIDYVMPFIYWCWLIKMPPCLLLPMPPRWDIITLIFRAFRLSPRCFDAALFHYFSY